MRHISLALLILLFCTDLFAQSHTITGTIVEKKTNKELTGVSIYLEGSTTGTVSNTKGEYAIKEIPTGNYTLVARFIGYDQKKLNISLNSDITIDFSLSENFTEISGIIIRGTTLTGGAGGINDIPGSAQYISPKELEKFSYNDVNRVLRNVSGVNIQEEDGFGLRPNIGLRGTGVERSSKITLMEDGILVAPAPYAAPSAYYFPTIGRMQGIEVRKGSSQIKYGPYTTGGAINFISTAIPKSLSGRVNIIGGSFGQRTLHANVGQSYDNVGFVIETYQASADGFKVLDNGGNTGFDTKDYMAKLRFNTNLDAKIYQSVTFKLAQADGKSDETYLGLTQEDFDTTPNRRYAGSQVDLMDTEQTQLSAQHIIRPTSFIDITTTFYRTDFKRNWYKLDKVGGAGIGSILDNPLDNLSAYSTIAGNGIDTLSVKANNRTYYSQGVQSIIGLQFNGEKLNHDIEIGIRVHKDEMDRFQWVDDYVMDNGGMEKISSGIPGTESNRIESAKAFAGFVQYTLNIDNLTFTPGIRYESITVTKNDYGKSDPSRTGIYLKVNENAVDVWIPGIGIDYKFNSYLSAFVGVHKGFSPPGSTDGANPEKSFNYEIGSRYIKKALRLNGVIYLNDYSNLLGSDLAAAGGAGSTDLFNGGEARIKGIELDIAYDLLLDSNSKFSFPVSVVYSYTDAEFRSTFNSEFEGWGSVRTGDELPYLAKHQLAINLGLDHKIFDFNISSKYVGEMRATAGSGEISRENKIGSQMVIDISSNVHVSRNLTLFGSIRNITDQTYLVSRRPAGLRPGMPRNFQLGVKAVF
jgi:Fe(3+) dicitrate transport protein